MSPWSGSQDPTSLSVAEVDVAGPHALEILFSDGQSGRHDFSAVRTRQGAMVAPLADSGFFARVFVEDGVLTWPNGYDWDTAALYRAMASAGELSLSQAAE